MYLLDTNAVSETAQRRPNEGFMNWFQKTPFEQMLTSCVVIGEIEKGVILSKDSTRQTQLKKWLANVLDNSDQILELDIGVMRLWAQITANAQLSGSPLPLVDAIIAAQCLHGGHTLVTRNVKDFERIPGLKIVCPWS